MQLFLTALDRQASTSVVIWLFPLAFLVHDLEEILTMERFVRLNRDRFPKLVQRVASITTTQFTIGVTILFVITIWASFLATRSPRDLSWLTICLAIFLLHVCTHVAQPLLLRTYTPGAITAVLVVLPYSLYAFHRLFSDQLISGDDFTLSLVIGGLLAIPILLGVRQLGKGMARFIKH